MAQIQRQIISGRRGEGGHGSGGFEAGTQCLNRRIDGEIFKIATKRSVQLSGPNFRRRINIH